MGRYLNYWEKHDDDKIKIIRQGNHSFVTLPIHTYNRNYTKLEVNYQ